jgi:hypothetical protein
MVMGKESAIDFITENTEFLAFFVFSDDDGKMKTWVSPGLAGSISETGN